MEEIARGYGIDYISSAVPKADKGDFSGDGDEPAGKVCYKDNKRIYTFKLIQKKGS